MAEASTLNGTANNAVPGVEVKSDPESALPSPCRAIGSPVRIKKEETDEDEPPFGTLLRPEEEDTKDNDMFDDVDGPEYVDLTYEGIAEVDGVNCFVCEGLFIITVHSTTANTSVEFKIRQIPKPIIVTRPLYQLFGTLTLSGEHYNRS